MKKYIGIAALVLLLGAGSALADVKTEDPNQGSSPKIRATGGPDAYGYEYIDSSEASGPAYSWVDITSTGTPLGLSDDGETDITTTNTYTFYGTGYTTFTVANNGGILATSGGNLAAGNVQLPASSSSYTVPVILPFWDDLDNDTGDVYWQEFGTCPYTQFSSGACLVVEWADRPHYNAVGAVTFEVILSAAEESMIFQYQDVDFGDANYDYGSSATVGIDNNYTTTGAYLEYSYNSADISNSLAILFSTSVPVELMSLSVE